MPIAGSPFTVASAADTTGRNTGNLTTAFTQQQLGTMPAIWEWFHATYGAADPTKTLTPAPVAIYRNTNQLISFSFANGGSEWDPSQALVFRQGDELYFYWQLASSVTPVPAVTIWLRYDADLPANRGYTG